MNQEEQLTRETMHQASNLMFKSFEVLAFTMAIAGQMLKAVYLGVNWLVTKEENALFGNRGNGDSNDRGAYDNGDAHADGEVWQQGGLISQSDMVLRSRELGHELESAHIPVDVANLRPLDYIARQHGISISAVEGQDGHTVYYSRADAGLMTNVMRDIAQYQGDTDYAHTIDGAIFSEQYDNSTWYSKVYNNAKHLANNLTYRLENALGRKAEDGVTNIAAYDGEGPEMLTFAPDNQTPSASNADVAEQEEPPNNDYSFTFTPAKNLPEGWGWREWRNGVIRDSLVSPKGNEVVLYDYQTKEYKFGGEWHYIGDSGFDRDSFEKLTRDEYVEPPKETGDYSFKFFQAKNLPEGWGWREWNDGSGDLVSPEGKVVVEYDYQTREYKWFDEKWHFMDDSGFDRDLFERLARDEYVQVTEAVSNEEKVVLNPGDDLGWGHSWGGDQSSDMDQTLFSDIDTISQDPFAMLGERDQDHPPGNRSDGAGHDTQRPASGHTGDFAQDKARATAKVAEHNDKIAEEPNNAIEHAKNIPTPGARDD